MDILGPVMMGLTLLTVSIMTFLGGYNYNESLRKQDQKGGRYITPNDSWLDEFFRMVVPYFPVNIAKFFYMGLGIVTSLLSILFIVGILLYY